MAQSIESLPVDQTAATQGDVQTVDRIISAMDKNPEVATGIAKELKGAVLLTVVFVVLSLPLIDGMLDGISFFKDNKVSKWIFKVILFFVFSYVLTKWWI
jgi:flagellar biosynthesis protein FlhB